MRLSVTVVLAASCYAPSPPAGTPCSAASACPAPLVCSHATMTCEPVDVPIDANENGIPGHVTVAPGWHARVLLELTGALPYRVDDFSDGTDVLDNAPRAVAALYPPFSAELAVSAGRAILEVTAGSEVVVHDYRPATADTAGPDQISHLVFGNPPDHGAALWAAASSVRGGDGLYVISSSWLMTREAPNNNGNGLAFDGFGAFDGIGAPTLYFIDQTGILRRTGPAMTTLVFAMTNGIGKLAVGPAAIYTVHDPSTEPTAELWSIVPILHTAQPIATGTTFRILESAITSDGGVVAIRDGNAVVAYGPTGAATVGATLVEPDWVFVTGSAPHFVHKYAGSFVVLESNRAANRDRLLLVTPP